MDKYKLKGQLELEDKDIIELILLAIFQNVVTETDTITEPTVHILVGDTAMDVVPSAVYLVVSEDV